LGICPVVKRIWTPSWVLFSGGWCFLLLAAFYWTIDVLKHGRWAHALVVIGANSIAAYVIAHVWEAFIQKNLVTNLGAGVFKVFGQAYQPLLLGGATLLIMWLALWWMYRRKVFLKI
jgi:predicted acyltransferase